MQWGNIWKDWRIIFAPVFQTWTLTWNGFEIPLHLVILTYHQMKKAIWLIWAQTALRKISYWFLTERLHRILNSGKQSHKMPDTICYDLLLWDRIFHTVGSKINEEEEAWSQRWHKINNFTDSTKHNMVTVITKTTTFLSLNDWGKTIHCNRNSTLCKYDTSIKTFQINYFLWICFMLISR